MQMIRYFASIWPADKTWLNCYHIEATGPDVRTLTPDAHTCCRHAPRQAPWPRYDAPPHPAPPHSTAMRCAIPRTQIWPRRGSSLRYTRLDSSAFAALILPRCNTQPRQTTRRAGSLPYARTRLCTATATPTRPPHHLARVRDGTSRVATTPHVARRVQWPSQAVSERRTRSAERCALAALTCADHLALCVQAASNRERAAVGGWQASCRGSPPRRAVAALVPSSSVRAGGECWPYRHCVLGFCARAGRGAAAIGLRGGAPVSRHHPQARGEPDRS
jgi:hypothetical protein